MMQVDTFLGLITTIALIGSLTLAVVDKDQRQRYMDIASASIGAFWGLQVPVKGKDTESDEQQTSEQESMDEMENTES